ncbi:RsmG family class I SAM-dependent methyltransferase [Candidatus Poriferisocius sp.]|uniref:RsmG family class I SAM-dependent methyltransferase n=1 Tax=Candidatus Poriferisocius sp. TaxID=3101276 RepID=UPI003B02EB56
MGCDRFRLISAEDRLRLVEVFGQAQERGWIGRQAIDFHIDHSLSFAKVFIGVPTLAVDLGSGGGLPALVLAAVWMKSRWTLVESSLRRAAFLEQHCAELGWSDRIVVRHVLAQDLGRDESCRGQADLVTARSFGPQSLVVEVGAPLLRFGGQLVVSAAPDSLPWPHGALAALGLGPDRLVGTNPKFHHATQLALCPRFYPRIHPDPPLF